MTEPTQTSLPGPAADGGYRNGAPLGDAKLTDLVTVRLTHEQYRALNTAAAASGVSPPGFLRNLLLRALRG